MYPQSMFLSRNKKNNVNPCKPQFYYIKVGFKGVKIIKVCFRDEISLHIHEIHVNFSISYMSFYILGIYVNSCKSYIFFIHLKKKPANFGTFSYQLKYM